MWYIQEQYKLCLDTQELEINLRGVNYMDGVGARLLMQ